MITGDRNSFRVWSPDYLTYKATVYNAIWYVSALLRQSAGEG